MIAHAFSAGVKKPTAMRTAGKARRNPDLEAIAASIVGNGTMFPAKRTHRAAAAILAKSPRSKQTFELTSRGCACSKYS